MKALLIALVAVAGLLTAWLAARSDAPSFRAPVVEEGGAVPTRLARPPGPGERVALFTVEGMCCGGCTGKLYAALTAAEGVREACVDFPSGSASALVSEGRDLASLAEVLTFDKYTARTVE